MELNEASIVFLEDHVPELFAAAVTHAYWGALAAGHSVLQRDGDELVEVFPDGTKKVVKHLPPMVPVEPGSRRKLL